MNPLAAPSLATRLPVHYGWVIVGAGMLTVFACLGLGRFALGMLLPSMGASLPLSYAEMGFISTGNFVGYLAAVVVAGHLVQRLGSRRAVFLGLFLVAASMMLVGAADGFAVVLILYVVTGLGSGVANVPIMGLVSHWFARRVRGKAAGYMVIGSGLAIVFSGWLVPLVNGRLGAEGWRASWLILGAIAMAAALACLLLLRNRPTEMGLTAVGDGGNGAPLPAHALEPKVRRAVLLHLGGIYFLFGFTYVIYATFIVTTLVQERGYSESFAGAFWAWVGFLSLLSGPVFGGLSDRLGRKVGLIVVFAFQGTAYLLVALPLPEAFLHLSVGLFGIVAWSIPSIMAAAVGDYMGPERAAKAFGLVTLFFGIGQIVGPALAGVIAELTGSFAGSYGMAAVAAALAIAFTLFLPRPQLHP
jgi:MFS family permease